MTEPLRISVLTRVGEGVNAIHDASASLVDALNRRGCEAKLVDWVPGAVRAAASRSDVFVVPYNPFLYGRWGFAPSLLRDIAGVRLRSRRPTLALVVHEPFVPIRNWRSLLMGTWQRFQLWVLLLASDHRFASIESWARRFSRLRPVALLPSGSNLPDARDTRAAVRAELGVSDHHIVVATLSTGNPAHLTEYVALSLERLAADGIPTTFLQLGAGSIPLPEIQGSVRVVRPGRLDVMRLASMVAASDIFLAPFVDGVSTRRTSFMAAIQHGIAVVGTSGPATDSVLLSAGLELQPVGDPHRYAATVGELAADYARRTRAGAAGQSLFESRFAWDHIAASFLLVTSGVE